MPPHNAIPQVSQTEKKQPVPFQTKTMTDRQTLF